MDARQRKLVRAVIKRVHPDLFSDYPLEQLANSEALKASIHPFCYDFVFPGIEMSADPCFNATAAIEPVHRPSLQQRAFGSAKYLLLCG